MSIPEIIDYYGERGFGAIAITDHLCEKKTFLGRSAQLLDKTLLQKNFAHYIQELNREGGRALKKYGMLVIPGVEITKNSFSHHDSTHIVALGINRFIDPDGSIDQIIDQFGYGLHLSHL